MRRFCCVAARRSGDTLHRRHDRAIEENYSDLEKVGDYLLTRLRFVMIPLVSPRECLSFARKYCYVEFCLIHNQSYVSKRTTFFSKKPTVPPTRPTTINSLSINLEEQRQNIHPSPTPSSRIMTTITGPVRQPQVQVFGMPLSIETKNETAFRKSCVLHIATWTVH